MLNKKHNIIDIAELKGGDHLFSPKIGDVILFHGKHFMAHKQEPGPHACEGCACKRFGLFCNYVDCEKPENIIFKKL